MPRRVLEGDQRQLIAPARLQQPLHRVDAGGVATRHGDLPLADFGVAVDLLDAGVLAEVLDRVDHAVDVGEHGERELLEVQGLPPAAFPGLLLPGEQLVEMASGAVEGLAGKPTELRELGAVRVDGALEAQQREQDLA